MLRPDHLGVDQTRRATGANVKLANLVGTSGKNTTPDSGIRQKPDCTRADPSYRTLIRAVKHDRRVRQVSIDPSCKIEAKAARQMLDRNSIGAGPLHIPHVKQHRDSR